MHIHLIDHYLPITSPIHQLDARIKVIFTLAYICACTLLPAQAWAAYLLMASITVSMAFLARLRLVYLLKRSLLALPFILAALPLIFRNVPPLIAVFAVGHLKISISMNGLMLFASIGIKSWLSVFTAILLASSTSFPDLLSALRAIRIPKILVAVLGLMWRYLSLMVEEASRIIRARLSRSGHGIDGSLKAGGGIIWRGKITGGMAGSLFVRSLERSERVYHAMLSRGYTGDIHTADIPSLDTPTRAILVLVVLMFSLLVVISNLFGVGQ